MITCVKGNITLFYVVVRLPSIGRMGFLDVDNEHLYLFFEFIVNIIQAPGLVAKGRSGVAAKGKRHRPLALEAG